MKRLIDDFNLEYSKGLNENFFIMKGHRNYYNTFVKLDLIVSKGIGNNDVDDPPLGEWSGNIEYKELDCIKGSLDNFDEFLDEFFP